MEKVKEPKANWDSVAHTIFMNACVEEVRANNRNGGYLSDIGQANLHKKFNERSGRNYSTRQIKNRWGVCRSEYNTWKTLIQQASGLGRDEHTHTIAATNEWWALEIKVLLLSCNFLNNESCCFGFAINLWCYMITGTSRSCQVSLCSTSGGGKNVRGFRYYLCHK